MSELFEKPTTIIFKITEYKRGCDASELLRKAGDLAASDEYLEGFLDDGYGRISWSHQDEDEVQYLTAQLEAITDNKTASPF